MKTKYIYFDKGKKPTYIHGLSDRVLQKYGADVTIN